VPRLRKAILIDKDGTLVEDDAYSPGPWRLRQNAAAALRELTKAGYLLAVVTNQSGIGRGYYTHAELSSGKRDLEAQLGASGISLSGFYVCPHVPESRCECRKPKPGLLLQAIEALSLDPAQSWMVGDKGTDQDAAKSAGVRYCDGHDLLKASEWIRRQCSA
jgi:D-glycero-D-manno-heptose 1,7-bisphosphate phosphatase